MTKLESKNEKLKYSQKGLPETERDLSKLGTWTKVGNKLKGLSIETRNRIREKLGNSNTNTNKKVKGGNMEHQRNTTNSGRNNLDSKESSNKQVVSEQWMYDRCIEYGITDEHQIAYILATVKREAPNPSGPGLKNREEVGKGKGKKYGAKDKSTGNTYYGRGFVQLTWKDNYKKMTDKIRSSGKNFKDNNGNLLKGSEIDLVKNPDLILKSNELAAYTTICGMKYGIFTGKKLDDYINKKKVDYVNARKIVNGKDHAQKLANNAQAYENKLGSDGALRA